MTNILQKGVREGEQPIFCTLLVRGKVNNTCRLCPRTDVV